MYRCLYLVGGISDRRCTVDRMERSALLSAGTLRHCCRTLGTSRDLLRRLQRRLPRGWRQRAVRCACVTEALCACLAPRQEGGLRWHLVPYSILRAVSGWCAARRICNTVPCNCAENWNTCYMELRWRHRHSCITLRLNACLAHAAAARVASLCRAAAHLYTAAYAQDARALFSTVSGWLR